MPSGCCRAFWLSSPKGICCCFFHSSAVTKNSSNLPPRQGRKNSSKIWRVFRGGKRGVKTPRLSRNPPQIHHQNTTTCTPFFQKTLQKHPLTTQIKITADT